MLTSLAKVDSVLGKASDNTFMGFQIGTDEGKSIFMYKVYLHRSNMNNVVDIIINPTTRKVISLSL
jgi:hypothetical protein